jgi:hypothetical protein
LNLRFGYTRGILSLEDEVMHIAWSPGPSYRWDWVVL